MAPQPLEVTISVPTTDQDFLDLATVEHNGFAGSPLMDLCFGTNSNIPFTAAKHRRISINDPSARYLVARLPSENNKIIGMAKWNFFLDDPPKDQFPWPLDFPEGSHQKLCEFFFGEEDMKRNEGMRGRKYFLMAILVVAPGYQRLGVGKKLLAWGLKQADRDGIPCWIDSSPAGKGLYEKVGWKEVSVIDINMKDWGGEDVVERTVSMVREPAKRE